MSYYNSSSMDAMKGKVFTEIRRENRDDMLVFVTDDGEFRMYHNQSCCESVYVESIVGDLEDLVGTPILMAEEATQDDPKAECGQWTFYKFATIKGYVDIRWYGSSNGYYGVGVSIYFHPKEQQDA